MSDEVYDGAIGIDLGTTYSCVANYAGNQVEISRSSRSHAAWVDRIPNLTNYKPVANEQGSYTTPSFVSFTSEERLIGEAAKNQAAMNPTNTIFDVKYAAATFVGYHPSLKF